jgi:hypothetical protein
MRVGFAKEELKESPFITKNNGLLLNMKMNEYEVVCQSF